MDAKSWIFEERKTTLKEGVFKEYLSSCRDQLWPEWERRGVSVLCLLCGHMGESPLDLVQMARFPDLPVWQESQMALVDRENTLIEREDVRLMRSIVGSRPKIPLSLDDHHPVYGYRRFFFKPADIVVVSQLSVNCVWPRFLSHGCNVLGLWTPLAITPSQEVLLITGYRSLAHWEETRLNQAMPKGFDPALWERGREAAIRRRDLISQSWVSMMRAVYLEGQS